MTGYNLPDNVSPTDPRAPWNQREPELTTYHVVVRDVSYPTYTVAAENKEAAMEMVQNGEVEDYEHGDDGEWEIETVRETLG